MKLDDYYKKKTLLESNHKKELALLSKEYALANNTINIGDKIKSGDVYIEVESIGVYVQLNDIPECVYSGKNLTKIGTQNKREPYNTIYQSSLNK